MKWQREDKTEVKQEVMQQPDDAMRLSEGRAVRGQREDKSAAQREDEMTAQQEATKAAQ